MSNPELDLLRKENSVLKEQLQQTRAKYQKLSELSGDALSIIDLDTGKFVECNIAAIEMHGVESEANFLNLSPGQISPTKQPCGRSSQEMASELLQKAVADGPQVFKWVHSRLDGSTFPCLVSLTALPVVDKNYILAIGRDLSDLEKTETQLNKSLDESEKLLKLLSKNTQLLEEEKKKFKEFVNLAPVGIAINRFSDGHFEYINEEFARFSGYSVQELNEMDYWDLTPKKYEADEAKQLEDMAKKGRYGPYQKEYIHKSGHKYPVLLSGVKITDIDNNEHIWSVVQDITAQNLIEKELKEAKEKADSNALRLNLANDSAEIGVWELDVKTGELYWDEWMYKLYGIKETEFSGVYEAWVNGVHPDDIYHASTNLQNAIKGTEVYKPEFRVVWPSGEVRTMKSSAEVVRDDSGAALKVIGVNYDITDKVKTIEALDVAKKIAEKSVQAKDLFLANMSHEIRTPMNGIYGTLQLLNQNKQSAENQELINKAIYSTKNLLTIINDILDFSKIEAGKLELENTQFNLLTVVESIVSDFLPLASDKGISLTSKIPDTIPTFWNGDPVRLRQILVNLTSNAVKFTEKGEVTISVDADLEIQSEEKFLEFTVSDSGIGMTQEALARLFKRFEQADKSTTRKYGGSGLGISITASLAEMMGGDLSVASTLGVGSELVVKIPLTVSEQTEETDVGVDLKCPDLTGKTILVAEDNEVNTLIINKMLSDTNAAIHFAVNGEEAVELADEYQPDMILMDIQMPVLDGKNACIIIRKTGYLSPIIAFTANVLNKETDEYTSIGFDGYLAKPIEINLLYKLLFKHFKLGV